MLKRPWTDRFAFVGSILILLSLLAALPPVALSQEHKKPGGPGEAGAPSGEVEINMSECLDSLWNNMPGGMSALVEREGEATTPECAAAALGTARGALNDSKMIGDMGKALAITIDLIGKISGYGLPAEVLQAFFESGGNLDTFKDKLGEGVMKNAAGKVGGAIGHHLSDEVTEKLGEHGAETLFKLLYDALHPDVDKQYQDTFGRLNPCKGSIVVSVHYSGEFNTGEVRIAVNGDCFCNPFRGGVRIGKFSIIGVAPISLPAAPEKKGGKYVMHCKLGQPKYYVAAACCQFRDGHWTGGGPGDQPPGQPVTPEKKPDPKKEADYRNIERRCDPDGKLRDDIDWNQRRLNELIDRNPGEKNLIDWRRSELTRLRGQLCPCLENMKAGAEQSHDSDTLEILKDMIAHYCVPPAEHRTTPAPTPQAGTPSTTEQPPCQSEKEAYEQARRRYIDGGGNNPSAELAMARAKKAFCDCARKKYGNNLPPDIAKFCDPKAMRVPVKIPAETALAPVPNTLKTSSVLVGVVLPADSRPGDTITGTVVNDPKTYEGNPALRVVEQTVPLAVDEGGKASLHGVVVDVGDRPSMPADAPLTYTVPSHATSIPIIVYRTGTPPSTPEKVPVETRVTEKPSPPVRYQTPSAYTDSPVQVVTGKFGGDANFTQVEMAGKPADVVAESPRAVYWKMPEGVQPGSNEVVVKDGSTAVSFPVSVLRLSINADRLTLKRGESTAYHVTVSGFEGLSDSAWRAAPPSETTDMATLSKAAPSFQPPAPGSDGVVLLTIQNASSNTVTLNNSSNGTVVIPIKQSDIKNGSYEYHGTIKSKQAGGFNINSSVVSFLSPVAGEVQPTQ